MTVRSAKKANGNETVKNPKKVKKEPSITITGKKQVKPLIGREQEHAEIYETVLASCRSRLGSYISGVPGTGKTATVRNVLMQLIQEECEFDWVEINGMKIASVHDIYGLMCLKLLDYPIQSQQSAQKRLEAYFKQAPRPLVMVIDEVDALVSGKATRVNSHLYRLLEWPCHYPIILLLIANTMDLPERLMTGRLSSRLGTRRVNFVPYTYPMLIQILKAARGSTALISDDAIEYLARRVGAVNGDARRALSLLKKACGLQGPVVGLKEMELMLRQNIQHNNTNNGDHPKEVKLVMTACLMAPDLKSNNQLTVELVMSRAVQLAKTLGVDLSWIDAYRILNNLHTTGLLSGELNSKSYDGDCKVSVTHGDSLQKQLRADAIFGKFLLA